MVYENSQARGWNRSCCHRAYNTATAMPKIRATLATYTTAHGNARSLTDWVRPGMKPESSWILVGFVTAEPLSHVGNSCLYFESQMGKYCQMLFLLYWDEYIFSFYLVKKQIILMYSRGINMLFQYALLIMYSVLTTYFMTSTDIHMICLKELTI